VRRGALVALVALALAACAGRVLDDAGSHLRADSGGQIPEIGDGNRR
jgi:hypothetical protein